MNILVLSDNFPPEVNAPASRTHEHARAWVKAGARVTVITCAPNFPHGRVYAGYANRPWAVEQVDGIRVVRVWSFMTKNARFVRRVIDYGSFALGGFLAGLFEAADVIVATSPQFFTAWAGAALGAARGKPWVFELRDLWPESAVAVGAMRPGRLLALMSRVELALYRHAAGIVAVSPAFRDRLIVRGIAAEKIAVVPNGIDPALFRPAENPALKAELGAAGRFLIAYVGTIGMAHGLEHIVDAMAELPQAMLLCVGEGAAKARLVTRAVVRPNVVFRDQVPRAAVPGLIAGADAMLVALRPAPTFTTVVPSKIFEAAAMEKPILLGVDGQARAIVEQAGAGLCFPPGDGAAFAAAVRRLAADPALARTLGQGGAALARTHDRNRLAVTMLGVLEDVVAQARARARA